LRVALLLIGHSLVEAACRKHEEQQKDEIHRSRAKTSWFSHPHGYRMIALFRAEARSAVERG
jgi:hypothetical protein